MKPGKIISERQWVVSLSFTIMFLLFSANSFSQKGIEISLVGYPGFTLVNFEKALGYQDDYMEDWDQFHYGGSVKGYFLNDKSLQLGVEAGWQRLYYAYYIVPYDPYSVYREFNVSTISMMALLRFLLNEKIFISGGAGVHIFGDGIAPAISAEAGYLIKAGNNLKIPISFRLTPVFGSGLPVSACIGAGISFSVR